LNFYFINKKLVQLGISKYNNNIYSELQ